MAAALSRTPRRLFLPSKLLPSFTYSTTSPLQPNSDSPFPSFPAAKSAILTFRHSDATAQSTTIPSANSRVLNASTSSVASFNPTSNSPPPFLKASGSASSCSTPAPVWSIKLFALLIRTIPEKIGVTPTVVSHNLVLKAFVQQNDLESARNWIDELYKDDAKVVPNIDSYNILLGAYWNKGDLVDSTGL
ncbi:Pentatricopeptide repeat-containing protein, mitochondrial, partial [Cucurbita argyrosperma subsp. sororia]